MARLSSWLSPEVMHALGWALIHSLWQCLAFAALAAALMALSRRPPLRYLVAVGALALMLAAPVATFFVAMKSTTPAPALSSARPSFVSAMPVTVTATLPATLNAVAVAAAPTVMGNGLVRALEDSPNRILSPSLLPWLVGSWLCGVAFLSLRLAGGFLLLEHRRRSHSSMASPHILALCQELQRQLGLDRAIRYLECGWLEAPAVIGWVRPVILLPFSALTGLTEDQLRAVIAHELAHIRRFDAFVNLFQILVETLLFYHPAVWWLNKRIRTERELCCDEIAVSLTGNRVEYARALTLMADWRNAPFLAMAANRGSLPARILHILGRRPSGIGQRMVGLTGSVLFLAAALAAANALFGIAAPPIAHAKESLKAALSGGQGTVDHLAQQVHAARGSVKDSASVQVSLNDSVVRKTAADQTEAARTLQPEKLMPPPADLSRLPPLERVATPTVLAFNAPPAATVSETLAAPALVPADPATTATMLASNQQRAAQVCVGPVNHVTGIVIAPRAIYLKTFRCSLGESDILIRFGEKGMTMNGYSLESKGVRLNVQLADPADASKMQPGKLVTVVGQFRVERENHVDYLIATSAKVELDAFGRSVPLKVEPVNNNRPEQVAPPLSSNPVEQLPKNASASAPVVAPNKTPVAMPNDQPARPALLLADAFPQVTPSETSVSTTPKASNATPSAAPSGNAPDTNSLSARAADTLAKPDANQERFTKMCNPDSNNHVTGWVISSRAIKTRGYVCGEGPQAKYFGYPPCGPNAKGIETGGVPCKIPRVTVNVKLSDPGAARLMQPGKLVTVFGTFRVETVNHVDYLVATDARVEADPFGRSAAGLTEPGKSGPPGSPSPSAAPRPSPKDAAACPQPTGSSRLGGQQCGTDSFGSMFRYAKDNNQP